MASPRVEWGRLLDFPEYKSFLRKVAERRQEAIDELIATKPSDTERMARAQERIQDCDWVLNAQFTEGE